MQASVDESLDESRLKQASVDELKKRFFNFNGGLVFNMMDEKMDDL